MNKEETELVSKVMEGYQVGYAYLYPNEGGPREEYVFDMTPENIANFIGQHIFDAEKMVLTDMCDRLILDTSGCFIDNCPNQRLCSQILERLVPIQIGEKEPIVFPIVKRNTFDEFIFMEEQAVMQGEMSMM